MKSGDNGGKEKTCQYGPSGVTGVGKLSLESLVDKEYGCRRGDCFEKAKTKQACIVGKLIPSPAKESCEIIVEIERHRLRMSEDVLKEGI